MVHKEQLEGSSKVTSPNEGTGLSNLAEEPDLVDSMPDGGPKIDQAIRFFNREINTRDQILSKLYAKRFQLTNELVEISSAPYSSTAKRKPQEFNPIQGLDSGLIYAKNLPQTIPMSDFEEIFVPKYCKVTHEKTHSLFEFHTGGYMKVEANNDDSVKSINLLYNNYGKLSPEDAANKLLDIITKEGKQELFVGGNPYYKEEKVVQKRIEGKTPGGSFPKLLPSEVKEGFNNDILIIPDSHGDSVRYELTKSLIEKGNIDWFAIEMLPHTMQKTVDLFVNSPEESEEYKQSRSELISYYTKTWNSKHEDIKSPEENPYFLLIEHCRKHRVQVKAMDVTNKYYQSNPQTDKLIVGTRNLVWAQQIPEEGRGVVFGGLAHFGWHPGIRVQDFLSEKRKKAVSVISFK